MNLEAQRRRDELLEMLWHLGEAHELTIQELRAHEEGSGHEFFAYLHEFSSTGLLQVDGDRIILEPAGREKARGIVRRHRLAARLIVDVLGKTPEETEEAACEFEHLLEPALVDAICTLLGHPQVCPHGISIPDGPCCRDKLVSVKAAVISLAQLPPGVGSSIAYINTTQPKRLRTQLAMGLTPGTSVKVLQTRPALVVQVDDRVLALEDRIAEEIFVVRAGTTPAA